MPLGPWLASATLLTLALPIAEAQDDPLVKEASDEGASALGRFQLVDGVTADLFAAEPLLGNPVCFCVDDDGRFYVGETFRHLHGVPDIRSHQQWLNDDYASRTVEDRVALLRKWEHERYDFYSERPERVRQVVDTDGDGIADRATVFAGSFNDPADGIGAGLLAVGDTILYTCIPHVWALRDTDGDGIADVKRSISSGHGVHIGFLGHDMHGLILGPDGRVYFSIGDRGSHVQGRDGVIAMPDMGGVFRCEPDGSDLELFATGLRNPQELAFDDFGNLFTGDNNCDAGDKARWVFVVQGSDSGWRLGHQWNDRHQRRGPWNAEKLWHLPFPGQAAYILPPVAHLANGPSGLTYDPGTGLDPRYRQHFFLCDFRGDASRSGVHAFRLEPRGASFDLVNRHNFAWRILATDVDFGVDGHLYATDWTQGWDATGKGRIYRLRSETPDPRSAEVQALLADGLELKSIDELSRLIGHADRRIRLRAQLALADREADDTLFRLAEEDGRLLARIHALWGLGVRARRGGLPLERLRPLMDDASEEVRVQTTKVLGEAHLASARPRWIAQLRSGTPREQLHAALACAQTPHPDATDALVSVLRQAGEDDRVLRHAAVMGMLACSTADQREALATDDDAHVRMGVLLVQRRLADPDIARFLDDPEDRLVLDAARAIFDLPIEPALPALAEQLVPSLTSVHFARRVLAATDQLDRADALAQFAATAEDASLAREAIRLLKEWDAPRLRDKVTNSHRPLPTRNAEPAQAAFATVAASLAQSVDDAVATDALRLGAQWSVEEVRTVARARALEGAPQVRAAALDASAALRDQGLDAAVSRALEEPHADLRSAARAILARLDPARAIPILEEVTQRGPLPERQAAFATLATMKSPRVDALLRTWCERLDRGEVDGAILLDVLEAARQRDDPATQRLLRERDLRLAQATPLERHALALEGGDAERGRRVFFEKDAAQCLRCHQVGDQGVGEAGPNLAGVASRRTRPQLLESIVAPNATISDGYRFEVLFLADGRTLNGQITEETEETVTIWEDVDDDPITVRLDSIDERRAGLSSMPANLLDELAPRELRDLVAYLATLREDETAPDGGNGR